MDRGLKILGGTGALVLVGAGALFSLNRSQDSESADKNTRVITHQESHIQSGNSQAWLAQLGEVEPLFTTSEGTEEFAGVPIEEVMTAGPITEVDQSRYNSSRVRVADNYTFSPNTVSMPVVNALLAQNLNDRDWDSRHIDDMDVARLQELLQHGNTIYVETRGVRSPRGGRNAPFSFGIPSPTNIPVDYLILGDAVASTPEELSSMHEDGNFDNDVLELRINDNGVLEVSRYLVLREGRGDSPDTFLQINPFEYNLEGIVTTDMVAEGISTSGEVNLEEFAGLPVTGVVEARTITEDEQRRYLEFNDAALSRLIYGESSIGLPRITTAFAHKMFQQADETEVVSGESIDSLRKSLVENGTIYVVMSEAFKRGRTDPVTSASLPFPSNNPNDALLMLANSRGYSFSRPENVLSGLNSTWIRNEHDEIGIAQISLDANRVVQIDAIYVPGEGSPRGGEIKDFTVTIPFKYELPANIVTPQMVGR